MTSIEDDAGHRATAERLESPDPALIKLRVTTGEGGWWFIPHQEATLVEDHTRTRLFLRHQQAASAPGETVFWAQPLG